MPFLRSISERNTPTCVGKTRAFFWPKLKLKKHPHLRGEDKVRNTTNLTLLETPPPAWGRRRAAYRSDSRNRNTPTCVGKTGWPRSDWPQLGKHPHLRGEDALDKFALDKFAETPPPAWGRLLAKAPCKASERNTPTCVGKTPTFCGAGLILPLHLVFYIGGFSSTPNFSSTNCRPEISTMWRRVSPTPLIS